MRRVNKSLLVSQAVIGAQVTFYFALGLSVLWLAQSVVRVQDGLVLITLLIMPALLYLVLSGRVSELRGPGGTSATFLSFAAMTVTAIGEKLEPEKVMTIEKLTWGGLDDRISKLGRDDPVVLTLTLGHGGYAPTAVRHYLATLSQFPRFRLVALLDSAGRFIGCTNPDHLEGLLRMQGLGQEFLDAVNRGDEKQVF